MSPALFLPGILLPAELRYAALFAALGDATELVAKELEVYRDATPPLGFGIATEIEGIARFADDRGWDRFHLYGHSGGGACALAFAARYPDRIATLALDEPASDFSPETRAELAAALPLLDLPPPERMAGFARLNLRADTTPPPPPAGPMPPWMAQRPAGVAAFLRALATSDPSIDRSIDSLRTFDRPVHYSHGTLSHERWNRIAHRLVDLIPAITIERFEGRSHFDTSHTGEPERVARSLRRLWRPD